MKPLVNRLTLSKKYILDKKKERGGGHEIT